MFSNENKAFKVHSYNPLAVTRIYTVDFLTFRGVLHNEVVKIPDEYTAGKREVQDQEEAVEEVQNALLEMGILEAVLNHVSSSSETVAREVLGVVSVMLEGGNEAVQNRFMKIWLSSREEPFFASIKALMTLTEETLKERRLMISKKKEVLKCKLLI